jgi:hypothetical protein
MTRGSQPDAAGQAVLFGSELQSILASGERPASVHQRPGLAI